MLGRVKASGHDRREWSSRPLPAIYSGLSQARPKSNTRSTVESELRKQGTKMLHEGEIIQGCLFSTGASFKLTCDQAS